MEREHDSAVTAAVPRTRALMDEIRRRMAARSLNPGERLPSIRGFAAAMGVSPSTVVEAYDRLAAEGLIRSRPGSGFFVEGAVPPLALSEVEPRRDRTIDPFWVSRQSLDARPATLRPGCGWLPADWMPEAAIRRAIRRLGRAEPGLLADYGPTRGSLALRSLLARQFAMEGIKAGADEILLTATGTQALDLLCRLLLQPGDAVLLDDPGYFNVQALLRAHRVRIVSVPHTPAGPDAARFAEIVAREKPRLYITNSAIHNPTGASLSPQTAHRVLVAAAANGIVIVEDEIFADFEPDPSPRYAVLAGLGRCGGGSGGASADVVRIGSFSKTLSASIRCGYIAARADWIEGLIDLQVETNFGGPSPIAAELVVSTLSDGSYRKHLSALRLRLARRRQEVATALAAIGIRPWTIPRGGFSLWCRLPDARDAGEVATAALTHDVVLAPGNVFSPGRSAGDLMRFNVAQMDDRVMDVLRRCLAATPVALEPAASPFDEPAPSIRPDPIRVAGDG